jgi:hypothetical protein
MSHVIMAAMIPRIIAPPTASPTIEAISMLFGEDVVSLFDNVV